VKGKGKGERDRLDFSHSSFLIPHFLIPSISSFAVPCLSRRLAERARLSWRPSSARNVQKDSDDKAVSTQREER